MSYTRISPAKNYEVVFPELAQNVVKLSKGLTEGACLGKTLEAWAKNEVTNKRETNIELAKLRYHSFFAGDGRPSQQIAAISELILNYYKTHTDPQTEPNLSVYLHLRNKFKTCALRISKIKYENEQQNTPLLKIIKNPNIDPQIKKLIFEVEADITIQA
jgi:hypothetical protein